MMLASVRISAATLRHGQAHEARGEFSVALACYDEVVASLRVLPLDDAETRRLLGVAWMNRGNALQKQNEFATAVLAYDEAIALLRELPPTSAHRNRLGAAWLNRGHALLSHAATEATRSFKQAIAILGELPLEENPAYGLNLAGAWTNLAHTEIASAPTRARASAATAINVVLAAASDDLACAEMSLRARRALVMALGELLRVAESARQPIDALADEASGAIDSGLAIACAWEGRGIAHLRPLALRLFRLGAQLYRVHQPHFLSEFLLENLDPTRPNTFARDPEFRTAAADALAAALTELVRPRLLVADAPESMRLLETVHDLRAAQRRLAEISA